MDTKEQGTSSEKIAVTGANGQLGKSIVAELLERVPADQVIACVREPEKAAGFADRGVDVRRVDFTEPDTLPGAFAGADQVLVVSVDKLGEVALQMHRDAVDAAVKAGVKRVLYTSHMGARMDSTFAPAVDHATIETYLAGMGISYTSLRHGFYAESALHLIGHGLKAGHLIVPEDGPVSWTVRADLAEADAVLLLDESRVENITPPLTAPEAFTMSELATVASEISGREIKYTVVSDEQWTETSVSHGMPAPVAEMLLGMYRAARRGDFATVDPTLEKLLGRRPQTMRDVLIRFFSSDSQ